MSLFTSHDKYQHQQSLAAFLPNGKAFEAKNINSTNLYKLLLGLAVELYRVENKMNEIADQYYIKQTTLLIDRWEQALGIPDDVFTNTENDDLATRITQVIIKLTLSIDTAQSFINLAAMFGYQITITTGKAVGGYPLPYPWTYFDSILTMNFTMYVNFSVSVKPQVYPFSSILYPWPYTTPITNIIESLFNKIKPANVKIIYQYK